MKKQNKLKKLQQYIFNLILLLLPANLAFHYIQPWSYVQGILIDYLIPTLYLTDILIMALLVFWLAEFLVLKHKSINFKFLIFLAIPFSFYFIYSRFYALNSQAGLYKLIKLTEFVLFGYFIAKKGVGFINLQIISLSVIWQAGLSLIQWLKQSSLIGYLNFGEQPFSTSTLEVKKISLFGQLKVLPMGTFTHPNVLAGFLFLYIIFILFLAGKKLDFLEKSALVLGSLSLFLTFSWLTILLFLAAVFIYALKQKDSKHISFKALIGFSFIFVLTIVVSLALLDPASISRRIKLSEISIKMWSSSPLFGIGLNNFVVQMEDFGRIYANYRFLQPVHNVYLLLLSESGIIGLALFFYILSIIFKGIKKLNFIFKLGLFSWLLLFCFDHYFISLQQGLLMTSLLLGIAINLASSATTATTTASSSSRKTS
jgi:O-antigen ligase